MFFTITRLGLALSAPSLILTQSVTTYSFTADGTPTSIVFSIPTVQTTTVTYTQAAYTITLPPTPVIETHTFTVTAPAAEIASIEGVIPQSVQVVAPSIAPGPIVPVVVHGYTASVQIPASASIPEGTYTPSPIHIAAATPAAASTAAADASQATANAKSAASEEGAVASNVAGDSIPLASSANPAATAAVTVASTAAADVSTAGSGIPTHLPIPIVPLVSASAAVQSADATASNAGVGASSTAKSAISAATEDFASTASVPNTIVTDTSSLLTPTPTAGVTSASKGLVTSTTSTTDTTSTTSSSESASSTSSAPAPSSSSSTAPAPSASSTAAPKSGAVGRKVAGSLLGAAAGFAGLLLFA